MNKNTRRYLIGVAFGFMGIIMYAFSLVGYENIDMNYVLDILKQIALPFIFTEFWVAIGVEGFRNLRQQFIEFKEKLNKKFEKKEAEARAE